MDTGKLIDSMKRVVKSELGSYDTTATVKRVEGDTAWVHIPGGVDETPVRLTMNAKEGDNVQVRVSDGKAFLAGNVSAPPTDDTTAEAAKALANRAAEDAGRAKSAADIAESYATSAQASAAQSANILEGMEQAAIAAGTTLDGIYADAAEAKATTDEINTYADTAGKTVTQILNDGETAGAAASAAQQAADTALVNLATTEDVVGVLNWITAHGTMVSQYGEVFDPDKVYFIADPTGDYVVSGTHYSVVPSPVAEDIDSYYILNISESVQNYVATHIVVDSEGLWIIPDAGGNKVLIATGSGSTYTTAGTYIVGTGNVTLASFTASGAQIGQEENGKSRSVINSDGMQITRRDSNGTDKQIVNLGYGLGTNSSGGQDYAPYVSLGVRSNNSVIGNYSVAEGYNNTASGYASHAEGEGNTASNYYAHAEGQFTTASGQYSHAEGTYSKAENYSAHAEGYYTQAKGDASHAEGRETIARSHASHAEGGFTEVGIDADYSHAGGYRTIASSRKQYAIGQFNIADTAGTALTDGDYAFIIGNGTADNARSNAITVDWSGNVEAAGGVIGKSMAGVMQMFAGPSSATPSGWLFCDGSAVSRTDYAELFAVIGDRFGSGDGSTTFNLPDMRARTPIGLNAASLPNGANSTYSLRSRADTGGAEKVTLTTNEMPSHHHDVTYAQYNRGTGSSTTSALQYTGYTKQTSDTGGGQAHENMPPFLAVGFIICTGKFA